ncbi:MAG: O-antigen ligase family protein [Candidatus Dormibacteraeota bacterium]|nr:O-antigen ligase family protein [Candidatus Dormibacteraeota bacterium]
MTSLQSPLETADAPEQRRDATPRGTPPERSTGERARRLAVVLMVLALAASPAYVLRPHLGPFPTTLLEIVLMPALAVGLYAFRDRLPWANPLLLPALLLLVAAVLDSMFAPDRRAAFGLLKAYFVEPIVAGLVVAAMARSRSRARLLLAGLGVAGSIVAVANIVVAVRGLLTHSFSLVTPPVVIYTSANAVPLYLEPLVAFALPLAVFDEDRRTRMLSAGFVGLAAVAIGLSFSRAGWMTLIAQVFLVALFGRWRWRLIGAAAAIAAAAFAGSHRVRDRILVELDPGSPANTIVLRLSLWRSTLNMLVHRPLLGSGLAGFKASIQPYRDPAYHENQIYPHNLFLNFWAETGLLGLLAFLWLMVQVVRSGLRGLEAGGWARIMSIGILGLVLSFFVHGLLDAPYFKNDQALAFWALVGIQLGSVLESPAR